MGPLEIRGYSERGVLNALCYEMRYSPNALKLLRDCLQLCSFPDRKPSFDDFRSAKFLIEQSFSDFGDLDLLILLDGNRKQSVLLEAKVKTYQSNSWTVQKEWTAFKRSPVPTSNLFLQLYRKMRLLRKLQDMESTLEADAIAARWSLGKNGIVRNAAIELSQYCSEAWLVALVPDGKANVHQLFQTQLSSPPPHLPDWQTTNVGYLTWEELYAHCKSQPYDWAHTLGNFEYNGGQIFAPEASLRPPAPGNPVTWNSPAGPKVVVVKNRGPHNTRVIISDGRTEKVPNKQLRWELP